MKNKLRTIPVNGQISFIFKHECYSCHHIIVIGNITIFLVSKFRIEMISLKSATTRLYDTEAKIICIVSKKGAQCIECHHKDI